MSRPGHFLKESLILLLVLVLSVACSPFSSRITVVENEGTIHFDNRQNSTELIALVQPEGCFSSSATQPLEQSGTVRVDTRQLTLRFETRFVLRRSLEGGTLDCGGGGYIEFYIGDVEPGVYTIWLGSRRLGQLKVPPDLSSQPYFQFSTKATATPLPSPSPTPAPTDPLAYP